MRWNRKVAAAAGLSAILVATTACAGAGGAGGGGGGGGADNSINVLMVNNPQMLALQKHAGEFTKESGITVNFTVKRRTKCATRRRRYVLVIVHVSILFTITGGSMSGKNTAVFGVYPTHESADAAVDTLRTKGFRSTSVYNAAVVVAGRRQQKVRP